MRSKPSSQTERDEFCALLQQIAWGKPYSQDRMIRPYPGTEAQQFARQVLVKHGIDWAPSILERKRQ